MTYPIFMGNTKEIRFLVKKWLKNFAPPRWRSGGPSILHYPTFLGDLDSARGGTCFREGPGRRGRGRGVHHCKLRSRIAGVPRTPVGSVRRSVACGHRGPPNPRVGLGWDGRGRARGFGNLSSSGDFGPPPLPVQFRRLSVQACWGFG